MLVLKGLHQRDNHGTPIKANFLNIVVPSPYFSWFQFFGRERWIPRQFFTELPKVVCSRFDGSCTEVGGRRPCTTEPPLTGSYRTNTFSSCSITIAAPHACCNAWIKKRVNKKRECRTKNRYGISTTVLSNLYHWSGEIMAMNFDI